MVSVDLIAMVTSEASDGHERRLRAKRVMVVFNDTPMEEGSGVFFLTAHFVIPVISLLWRKVLECSSSHCSLRHPCDLTLMEEGSGVFFLTLLTSSSLCPHSLRHPCVLTHSYGGSFWSVLPHCSLRHPCVLTPMTCLLTHLIVIPDFFLESSHPSHP